ncbi:hypothetical protein AAZV13_18G084800 [Glycine max]
MFVLFSFHLVYHYCFLFSSFTPFLSPPAFAIFLFWFRCSLFLFLACSVHQIGWPPPVLQHHYVLTGTLWRSHCLFIGNGCTVTQTMFYSIVMAPSILLGQVRVRSVVSTRRHFYN